MPLKLELVFERGDDRLDPLPDPADRGKPLRLVDAAGTDEAGAELAHRLGELAAGEALVAGQELAFDRLPLEQGECGLALGGVGGDEVEIAHTAVRPAEQNEAHAPGGGASGRARSRSRTRGQAGSSFFVSTPCPHGSGVVSRRAISSW